METAEVKPNDVKIKEPYIDKYGDIRYNDFEEVVIIHNNK